MFFIFSTTFDLQSAAAAVAQIVPISESIPHCIASSAAVHHILTSSLPALSLLPKQRSRFPQSCLPVLTSQSKGVSAELHELLLRKLSCGEPKSADRKLLQQ